jgi:DNA repair protein RadC
MKPRPSVRTQDARQLLLTGHPESVSDEQLISLLFGYQSAGRDWMPGEGLMPDALWRLSAEELIALEGVGPAGAARILACLEISRRAAAWRCSEQPVISTPEDVVAVCAPQLRGVDKEHFWVMALNTKNRLIKMVEVSVGSLNASIVHPRELFREAVRASAASVIAVHNHPSGDPTPSGADIQLTSRLVKAGDVLGIEMLDHVVIGDGGNHASLRDLGLM